MADMAVSFALDHLFPLLNEEANLLKSVHKEFADIKKELEYIQACLKDANRRAVAEGGNSSEGVKIWVKDVREAAFHIEDIIDEYMVRVGHQPRDPGCAALLCKIAHLIKTLIPRHQIASEIRDIKSSVREIKERSARYGFQNQPSFEQGSSRSQNSRRIDPRMAALYVEEAQVVGFEAPRQTLIDWLVEGRKERTVISLVGMGGQGKTTLAKKVFDNKEVFRHFDSRAWITVSQSYTVEGLLRDMLYQFYKQKREDPSQHTFQMDQKSLIDEVRSQLQQKRYVVVFDDVWNKNFWDEIQFAIVDVKNGSRIIITTRHTDVSKSCKKSSLVKEHKLLPLTQEQSLELFYKKAFFDLNGCCPENLMNISSKIVKKCEGLPLAIVAIGGLLCCKDRDPLQWQRFSENLNLEVRNDSLRITNILGMSYDDLPYYLKSCFLYFGIYPEDYVVESERLIRQWIAEGFVKEEKGKTLEEVAKGYLTELIHRSLIQVSSITIDGEAKSCRVHDMLRVMILEKSEDLNFCHHVSVDGQSSLGGMIRRLSITASSNDLMESILESPRVRSLFFFPTKETPKDFMRRIFIKYRSLKVLDFGEFPWIDVLEQIGGRMMVFAPEFHWINVPKQFGSLIHLKYLSIASKSQNETTKLILPKSIGMLYNLETLDLGYSTVDEMPKEASKLRKLRHLLCYRGVSLIQLKDGIGGMTSLQTLNRVELDGNGAVELEKLKQLRELRLYKVIREHEGTLSSSINEMKNLEKLSIRSKKPETDFIHGLHFPSPPPMLRNLILSGKLEKLPKWIPQLQNLVKLVLGFSQLIDDPTKSLQNMQNLLSLYMFGNAYGGESLHFHDGGFQKLKELYIDDMDNLTSMVIDKGTLHSLEKLSLHSMPKLKTVPTGIQHLEKLQVLDIWWMPTEFEQSIRKEHWINEHVPLVKID